MIVFTKIKKIKQKLNLEPASAASGRNSRYTYGEIFANKIQVFFSEIFKKYWHNNAETKKYVFYCEISYI